MKKSITEQYEELTESQKRAILKVDKWGNIAVFGITFPGMVLLCFGLVFKINGSPLLPDVAYLILQIIGGLAVAASLGLLIYMKVKHPYYSDRLASMIRKARR